MVMKMIKILYRTVAVLLLVSTFTCMFLNYSKERNSGGYTGVNSIMSNSSKQWVIDNFDEYETFDDLLYNGMTPFVLNNFVYDSKYNYRFPLQSFNFELFQNVKWHGVCFQFAQWAKSVVLEWSNHKGIDVQSYIFDVELKGGGKHSYNFFVCDGNTYCVDFTEALTLYNKNKPYGRAVKNIGKTSMYYYAEIYYEDYIYNVY